MFELIIIALSSHAPAIDKIMHNNDCCCCSMMLPLSSHTCIERRERAELQFTKPPPDNAHTQFTRESIAFTFNIVMIY